MENQKQHQYRQQPDHTARKPHGNRKTVIVEVIHDINTERKRRVVGHINQRRIEIIPKRDKLQQHNGKEYIAMRDKENKIHYFDKSNNLSEVELQSPQSLSYESVFGDNTHVTHASAVINALSTVASGNLTNLTILSSGDYLF